MKNSLGTLAAVAALAAAATTTTASADVQYTTHLFGDFVIGAAIDINNDGITDYNVINTSVQGTYAPLADTPNQIAVGAGNWLHKFAFNDTIGSDSTYNGYAYIDLFAPSIIGLGFYVNEDLHYAWLQLDMVEGNLVILDGAWQTSANTPLEVVAVPEPSTMAAGIALLVGSAALLRRRSRRNAS